MRQYNEVVGGSVDDAERAFPWLKTASFNDAVIDISDEEVLVWKDGFWEDDIEL